MPSSLRKQLKKEITKKCPKLSVTDKDHWHYIAHKGWALSIFAIYALLYTLSICISFPDCMGLITLKDAQELNNSSNGILASIVGITMVIIGFIFTELKSKSFVDFNFFSERTFIFPIFYSSLANISGMILISLFGDSISTNNVTGLNNAVIFGHYMILINIALIIVIFIRVATYMDYQPVFDSYKSMVIKKAKILLLQEKIYESFKNSISKVFSDNDINTIYTGSRTLRDPQKAILSNQNKKGIVYDINIKDLTNKVSELKQSHPTEIFQYSPFLLLGKTISANAQILYANETSNITLKTTKSIKVKSSSKEDTETVYKTYLDGIHQRYIDAVRSNNTNQAIDYLSIYQELYDLYCQTNKDLK
jgi:hypothetical protein